MNFYRRFPYTNLNDINLDWIIKKVKALIGLVDEKQDKPASAGMAGQVLGLDENLDPIWLDQSGGGSGTSNYNNLSNKPQIESVTLSGNKTADELGLALASDVPTKTSDLTNDSGFVNATEAAAAAPVQSVNGGTGNVSLAIPSASSALPQMDGVASAGSNFSQFSRGDHVHPHDTSKLDAPTASGTTGQVLALGSGGGTEWIDRINDSGWFDLTNYLDPTYVAIRTGYTPKVRIINGVMYYSGEVYIHTQPSGSPGRIKLFDNIPAPFCPNAQISAAGFTYGRLTGYFIYAMPEGDLQVSAQSYEPTLEYQGFSLAMLSGNLH